MARRAAQRWRSIATTGLRPGSFFMLMNAVAARSAVPRAEPTDSSPVVSVKVERRADTHCCFCEQVLDGEESVLWVPGIDLPAHEGCLKHELELRLAN